MPQKTTIQLDMATLAEIDGGSVNVAFRKQALIAARDVIDRPKLKKRRKITTHTYFDPLVDSEGNVRGVSIEVELIPVKVPSYVTFPHQGKVTMNGFEFDPATADATDE